MRIAACGQTSEHIAHWMHASGSQTGISRAMLRFSHWVVPVGKVPPGGIAETGTLILWPDAGEPRLMSLVPPVHVALLDADRLYENLADVMRAEHWAAGMPTNALLISGPSKTADIEQTLAYGIHGPKQLITLILQ